jgi:predicted permease
MERPPRVAARVVRWAAARLAAPELPDDAAELFVARVRRDGAGAARRWYRMQALGSLGRALLDRSQLRGEHGGGPGDRGQRGRPGDRRQRGRAAAAWLGGMSLDFRLGFRMLVKYPGLTVVGGLAMAFAIWAGAVAFETATRLFRPTLPLEEGERVVGIRLLDAATGEEQNPTVDDYLRWRGALRSVEALGAFRDLDRNLIAADGRAALVAVAEITASAFTMARVPPLLGRPLVAADELPGAAPVAVVGHDVWRRHFASDSLVVGRSIRLGRSVHTVVGVMPGGFEFPVGESVWVPLRAAAGADPLDSGRRVRVFGRLGDGVTLAEAQGELAALGALPPPTARPDGEELRPRVMPYLSSVLHTAKLEPRILLALHLFAVLLVVLICGNVALLMFARAATRESELITRSALGASRGRIVGQLFAEAAALAFVASGVGLVAADLCVRWRFGALAALGVVGQPPLWERSGLSPATLGYAGALALIASAVAGVVPGLKVTRGLEARLRRAAAGGAIRFGGIWTVIVVTQVAAMVAFPPIASILRGQAADIRSVDSGFDAQAFLQVRLEVDGETGADASGAASMARVEATARALERRLESEAGVVGVTFSDGPPLMTRAVQSIEVDTAGAFADSSGGAVRVKRAAVAPDYLALVDAPVLAGRGFAPADVAADARVVIVNQSFVERVLAGRNPIGQRIRYVRGPDAVGGGAEPWYEIVGVVRDIGRPTGYEHGARSGLYHPLAAVVPTYMIVHVRGEADRFVPRLRSIAAAVDPTLRLHDPITLAQINREDLYFVRLQFWLVTVVSAGAMLLSLAGIYSVLSFTVSQRTREMGVRLALGGGAWAVAATMIRRPLTLVGAGVLLGAVETVALVSAVNGVSAARMLGVAGYIVLMVGVCALASLVPVRRALTIEPTEALRTDG